LRTLRFTLFVTCARALLGGALLRSPTPAAASDTSPKVYYYCVSHDSQGGIALNRFTAPETGQQCFSRVDDALAYMGEPPTEFWASLPPDQQSDLPPGAHFNQQACGISMSLQVSASMIPGKVYWGRCSDGWFVEQMNGRYDPKANPPLASSPVAATQVTPKRAVRARSHANEWRKSMRLVWSSHELRAYVSHRWWRLPASPRTCHARSSVLQRNAGACRL